MSKIIKFNSNPITDYLLQNWQRILEEFLEQRRLKLGLNLLEVQNSSNKLNAVTFHEQKPLYEGNILAAALYLKKEVLSLAEAKNMAWGVDEEERWWPDNLEQMPTLKKWVIEHKDILASCVFYTAQPGSRINHHYGVDSTKDNIRIHLCLTDDPKCIFDIENQRHVWVAGEMFGFDDALFYHAIKHEGSNPRTVLVVDIKKSAMRPYAQNWPEVAFIPRTQRTPPTILNW